MTEVPPEPRDEPSPLADELRDAMPPTDVAARADLEAVRRRLFPQLDEPPALRVDRFVVHRRIGAGGMGVVFEAWDPKLGRKIALKVLRAAHADALASERLVREAQALAQLRHPNVVTVHDVGLHDGEVFIAMDFVEGCTLGQWLATPRRTGEIIDLFTAAGRGLAAAHEAGLVHRDFKPDNVLVADDGTPLVADFGVARAMDELVDAAVPIETLTPGTHDATESMTATGAFVGTPAYMAPEQLRGSKADARSDQFAFAVALYEALVGRRPFEASSPAALERAIASRDFAAVPNGRSCPRAVRKVLVRALAPVPSERHPSMRALLGALAAIRRRARRRRLGIGAVAACALGAGVAIALTPPSPESTTPFPCEPGDPTLGGHWTAATQAAIAKAFDESGVAYAADAWSRVGERVDAYAADYGAMQREACEAAHVRGEQTTATLELRLRCLERREAEADALLEVFASADADTVSLASDAVEGLTPISVCADVEELARIDRISPLPEDPRARRQVEALRRDLARLRSYHHAGRNTEGLELSRQRLDEAIALGHEPSIADARYRIGAFLALLGDPQGAEGHLEAAFVHALAGGDDTTAAMIAATSAHVIGIVLQRDAEGQRWARIAEALAERVGDPAPLVGRTSLQQGNAALLRGEYEVGREALQRAAEAFSAAGLEGELGETLTNLAVLERRAGDYAKATQMFAEAEPILLRVYGEHHPRLATFWNNRAALDMHLERWDAAETGLLRALAAMRGAAAPMHASLAHPLNNLGEVAAARGRHAEALAYFDEAVEVWRVALGVDHPLVAHALTQRSLSLHALGRDVEALADATQALEIRERRGSTDPELAQTRRALAQALPPAQRGRALGLMAQARKVFVEAAEDDAVAAIDAWRAAHDLARDP